MMNENEQYIANAIRLWVWSGLFSPQQTKENIYDIIENGDNEAMLLSLVDEEVERKSEAEQSWPTVTDYEKLDNAFQRMRTSGIVAIHNAGWDKAEGFHECLERFRAAGSSEEVFGLCYYTTQDVEHAIDQDMIYLGVGATRPEKEAADAEKASRLVCRILHDIGLITEWDGDTKSRVKVYMKWQKRFRPIMQHPTPNTTPKNLGAIQRFLRRVTGR